jgi:CheY-like chemotaxis protein
LDVFAEMLAYKATLAINPASCDVYSPSFCECSKECACTEILLIDQNMPGMTGLELIQRQHEFGCKIAANFVMQKPVSFEVLEQILNTIEEQGQELEAAG